MPDRIVDITSGVIMVVSDLHGDKDAFSRYVGRFLQLRQRKKVDRLLLLGDLIHRESAEDQDDSLQMVLDVIRMQRSLPPGSVIMLLGNHEMPHIYGVSLAKGNTEYTPRFEKAMTESGTRGEVLGFFDSLPFYVRTGAGVLFTHAGPDGSVMANFDQIRKFDHQAILNEFDHALSINPYPEQLRELYGQMSGMTYEVLARYYLSVSGPDDPRYDDLVRSFMVTKQSPQFEILWDALFTRCEYGTPEPLYSRLLAGFLDTFSNDTPIKQRFIVTGHIAVQGGYHIVNDQHLRLASATHAYPREAGGYLLLDCSTPIESIEQLANSVDSVF